MTILSNKFGGGYSASRQRQIEERRQRTGLGLSPKDFQKGGLRRFREGVTPRG